MKVISYSLWGDNPIYTIGAIRNAEIAREIYPGWECWYYVGTSVPRYITRRLEMMDNVKVFNMKISGDWTGMFWRFYPASNSEVDVMLSRDTDSRLSYREADAVDNWLQGNKLFHIMRDHAHHGVEILGGMWGSRGNILINMESLIKKYKKGNFWQVDQDFLKKIIYPMVKDNTCVHDEYFDKKPFPTPRKGNEFVGQSYDNKDREITITTHN